MEVSRAANGRGYIPSKGDIIVRLLFATEGMPYPPDSGGRVPAFYLLRELRYLGFPITLFPLTSPSELSQYENMSVVFESWGVRVLEPVVLKPRSNKYGLLRTVLRLPLDSEEQEYLQRLKSLTHLHDILLWYATEWCRLTVPVGSAVPIPKVFLARDSITLFEKNRPTSSTLLGRAVRFGRITIASVTERAALLTNFDRIVFLSRHDVDQAASLVGREHKKRLAMIPLGVETSKFFPGPRRPTGAEKVRLLFTGVMNYKPNVDAALLIMREVVPRLQHHGVQFEVLIVGRDPAPVLFQEAIGKEDVVRIVGWVADIARIYQEADIFVAPIRWGAGAKNKVLEALSSGLPVVAFPHALSGFETPPPGVVLCSDLDELVSAIRDFALNREGSLRFGVAGREFVERNYSWQLCAMQLTMVLKELLRERA